jgi:hypothetical protein
MKKAKKSSFSGEFTCQELNASILTYSIADFKKLKAKAELKKWSKELNDNASSYPLFDGSPFDDDGLSLPTSIDEEPDSDMIYVVPYYYYQEAQYQIENVSPTSEVKLAPILGILCPEKPMDFIESDGEQLWFEGLGSSDGTDYSVSFFRGAELIGNMTLEEVNDKSLKEIQSQL